MHRAGTHYEHVVELQSLCLRNRHHQRRRAQRKGQPCRRLGRANQNDLVRAKLDGRGVAVGARQQDGQVRLGQRRKQQRTLAVEKGALARQRVHGQWEKQAQTSNTHGGSIQHARMRPVVELQAVDARHRERRTGQAERLAALRLIEEERADVGEAEPDAARNRLRRVTAQQNAGGVFQEAHVQQQLRLREVLHLVAQKRAQRRAAPAVLLKARIDGSHQIAHVVAAQLGLDALVRHKNRVQSTAAVLAEVGRALAANLQVRGERKAVIGVCKRVCTARQVAADLLVHQRGAQRGALLLGGDALPQRVDEERVGDLFARIPGGCRMDSVVSNAQACRDIHNAYAPALSNRRS